jgi:hypothetical protein
MDAMERMCARMSEGRSRKPGCIEPVEYYQSASGHVILAPYTGAPCPPGYDRRWCDTLHQVDDLERRLQQQEHDIWERTFERESSKRDEIMSRIRSNLRQRMLTADCTPYEKDYITAWLDLNAGSERRKYFADQMTCYLWARHNMSAKGRRADEETVTGATL